MAGGKNTENMQKIDLTTLSLPQLAQLKQQLEQVPQSTYHSWLINFTNFGALGSQFVPRLAADSEDCADQVPGVG